MKRDLRAALATQAVSSGGQFVLSLLLVRELGLEGFGVACMVLLGATYVAGLVQALFAQPLLAMGCSARHVTVAAGASGVLAVAAGACGGGVAYCFGVAPLAVFSLLAAKGTVPVLRSAVFALGRVRATIVLDGLTGCGAAALVLAAGPNPGVDRALGAVALAHGLAVAVGVWALPWTSVTAGEIRTVAERAWASGRWLALNQVASWFGSGSFLWAAAVLLGPVAIGAIRTAQTVVGVLGSALQALELTLPVRARAVWQRAPDELPSWIVATAARLAGVFALAGGAIATSSVWVAGWIVAPGEVEPTARAIAVLAWIPAVGAFTGVLHVGFRAVECTRPVFVAYAVASLVAACAAVPVVDGLGLGGAAAGLLGSQVLFAALLAAHAGDRLGRLAQAPRMPRATASGPAP